MYLPGLFVLSIGLMLGGFTRVAGAEGLVVTNIQPIYVEKGEQNFLVTVKAHVTNNNTTDNVNIEVIAVDAEGFQLQTVKLTGQIETGKTKVLLERVKMAKQTFEQITKWELKP